MTPSRKHLVTLRAVCCTPLDKLVWALSIHALMMKLRDGGWSSTPPRCRRRDRRRRAPRSPRAAGVHRCDKGTVERGLHRLTGPLPGPRPPGRLPPEHWARGPDSSAHLPGVMWQCRGAHEVAEQIDANRRRRGRPSRRRCPRPTIGPMPTRSGFGLIGSGSPSKGADRRDAIEGRLLTMAEHLGGAGRADR
jgi:hypothetical protein